MSELFDFNGVKCFLRTGNLNAPDESAILTDIKSKVKRDYGEWLDACIGIYERDFECYIPEEVVEEYQERLSDLKDTHKRYVKRILAMESNLNTTFNRTSHITQEVPLIAKKIKQNKLGGYPSAISCINEIMLYGIRIRFDGHYSWDNLATRPPKISSAEILMPNAIEKFSSRLNLCSSKIAVVGEEIAAIENEINCINKELTHTFFGKKEKKDLLKSYEQKLVLSKKKMDDLQVEHSYYTDIINCCLCLTKKDKSVLTEVEKINEELYAKFNALTETIDKIGESLLSLDKLEFDRKAQWAELIIDKMISDELISVEDIERINDNIWNELNHYLKGGKRDFLLRPSLNVKESKFIDAYICYLTDKKIVKKQCEHIR